MSHRTRLGALLAAGTLATTGLVSGLASPAVAATSDPARQAASWLRGQASQNAGGLLQSAYLDTWTDPANPTWTVYDDPGLTIDAAQALAAIGGEGAGVDVLTNAVEAQAPSYASTGAAAAKLLVLAQTAGRDAATFGGGGLVSKVESDISTTPGSEGRLDNSYDAAFSQILAVRALDWVNSADAPSAEGYLAKQQCAAGFFPGTFSTSGCVEGTTQGDVDATAYAVMELSGIPSLQGALDNARAWLVGQQKANGAWTGASGDNADTTGLAAWAIGPSPAATRAARWIRAHQAQTAGACVTKLTPDAGAIAVGDDVYDAGASQGIAPITTEGSTRPNWVRATAQALPALQYLPAAGTLGMTGPTGYVKAGSSASLSVAGVRAGSVACLEGPGSHASLAVDSTGKAAPIVTLPSATTDARYTATDSEGRATSVTVHVLGAKRLVVRLGKTRVHRGARVRVTVTGLASGEKVTLRFAGRTVRVAHADAAGRFTTRVRVGHRTGKRAVVALGEFASLRHGRAVVRVTR